MNNTSENCSGYIQLPYEKFLKAGPEALSETELLAVILRTGTKNCPSLELAGQVLALSGDRKRGLNGIHHLSLEELKSLRGIGDVKAVKIKCIAELAVRMAKETAALSLAFDSPGTVADYYMEAYRHSESEQVLLLLLDNKLHLIKECKISMGTVNASLLSPREVFIHALSCHASRIMLLHNHPSGDPSPSKQDIVITRQIKDAGNMIGVPLTDHIIIGDNRYCSLKEKELI